MLRPGCTFESYFHESLSFLKDHQHLYKFSNIDILINNCLTHATQNSEILEQSKFNATIERLSPLNATANSQIQTEVYTKTTGIGNKKTHEINLLAPLISGECEKYGVSSIVDLGSGLGYLSSLLNERHGLNVIGIEGDVARVKTANERIGEYSNSGQLKHVHHYITDDSAEFIENLADERFEPGAQFMIVGLHACADLTVDALKLFLAIRRCKGVIIMPCCYHKMKFTKEKNSNRNDERFDNLPLSEALGAVYRECGASAFVGRPFLRLGCQRRFRSEDQDVRVFHLMSRAVIQLYCHKASVALVKTRRKVNNRSNEKATDFRVHLSTGRYTFKETTATCDESNYAPRETEASTSAEKRDHFDKLVSMWNELRQEDFNAAKLFLSLQDYLQPLCENIILLDKLAYLEEQKRALGLETMSCKIIKVADADVSPRCYAIVAMK